LYGVIVRVRIVIALVAAACIVSVAAPSDAVTAAYRAANSTEPTMCFKAFPGAHTTDVGRTSIYNRQASVQEVICLGFGRNPSTDFDTDGVACGLLAAVLGPVEVKGLAVFADATDGACSGIAIADQPKAPERYIEAACSWGADLLGVTPAKLLGTALGLACAAAPALGHSLGGLIESAHELDVARQIIDHGKCLKFSPSHFGSPWLSVKCAPGDAGFSTLPRIPEPLHDCSNAGTPEEMFVVDIAARGVSCATARRFIVAFNDHTIYVKERNTHFRGYLCRPSGGVISTLIRCTSGQRLIRWVQGT
jgi:hypothetical protein